MSKEEPILMCQLLYIGLIACPEDKILANQCFIGNFKVWPSLCLDLGYLGLKPWNQGWRGFMGVQKDPKLGLIICV